MEKINCLSKIKNKKILCDLIFDEVDFLKLTKLFYKNKSLQKIMKINLETYKILHKASAGVWGSTISNFMNDKVNRANPNKTLEKYCTFLPFMKDKTKTEENTNIEFVASLPSSGNFLVCGDKTILVGKNYPKGTEIKCPFPARSQPIEMNEDIALIPCQNTIISLSVSTLTTSEILNLQGSIITICKNSPEHFVISAQENSANFISLYSYKNNVAVFKSKIDISETVFNLLSSDNCIASFYENSFYLFDFKRSKIIKSLTGHNKSIFLLIKLSSNRFASGSVDGVIKVWHNNLKKSLFTINAYENKMIISMIEVPEQKMLIVSGNDEVIRVFNSEKGSSLFDLKGHTSFVPTLSLTNDKQLISCSFDKSIRFWNLNKKACDLVIQNVFSLPRFIFQLSDNTIYGAYYNGRWEQLSVLKNLSSLEKEKRIQISDKDDEVTIELKGLSLL